MIEEREKERKLNTRMAIRILDKAQKRYYNEGKNQRLWAPRFFFFCLRYG